MEDARQILVYTTAYLPHIGGAELAIKEITDRFPESFRVTIITARLSASLPRRARIGRADVIRVGLGIPLFDKFLLFLFGKWIGERALEGKEPDCVWASMASYGGLAALAYKRAHPRIPFLLTLQEGDSHEHIARRARFLGRRFKEIFKRADAIQVISQYLGMWAREMGARVEPVVIPNGVNIEDFKYKATNIKNHIILITTSRLVKKNAVDDIIRALAHLPEQVKLTVVGEGIERHALEALAKSLGVQNRISFLGAIVPEKIPHILADADIFVRPSLSEGLGNSFLEAFAAGLPVIATPVGGIPDFLTDGETGWFAEVRNPESIAACVRYIIDPAHREHVDTVTRNARALVEEKYSWDGISKKILRLIEQHFHTQNPLSIRKRILLVTPLYPPEIGGPATYAVLLASHLPEMGFSLRVLRFSSVRKLPRIIRHCAFFFATLIRGWNTDIIFAQDTVSVGFPALCAAQILRKKFIVRVPGDYAWEQSVQRFGVKDSIDEFQAKNYGFSVEVLRRIQRIVVHHADLVITPSKYFNALVSKWMNSKARGRVCTIYNGIDTAPLETIQHGISNQKKTILSAGRLVPWKGFTALISMMLRLPGWRLIIVGDGPDRKHLQDIITHKRLDDRVVLTGQLSKTELIQQLVTADVFVLNTSFESFSYQVVEALYLGIPVIATRVGNLPEIITDGHNGFLVEPDDIQSIADRIREIESDRTLRENLIRGGESTAAQFSIQSTIAQLIEQFYTV